MVLASYKAGTLNGLHHVLHAQFLSVLCPPIIAFTLLAAAAVFLSAQLSTSMVMTFSWVAFFSACVGGIIAVRHFLPRELRDVEPEYNRAGWLRAALPMVLIGVVHIVNKRTDILMLGMMMTDADVGVYSVACRYADFVTFPLLAANSALSPAVASLFAEGSMARLQRMVTKSARAILALSLPLALGIFIFRSQLLLLFGAPCLEGETSLVILTTVNVLCAASGSASLILTMTGHEREVALWAGSTALLNIVLNAFFIPRWGINGAAVATAITAIIRNGSLIYRSYARLGIHTTAVAPYATIEKRSNPEQ
jgi:O-antigen/teichoic acid export membrane protein